MPYAATPEELNALLGLGKPKSDMAPSEPVAEEVPPPDAKVLANVPINAVTTPSALIPAPKLEPKPIVKDIRKNVTTALNRDSLTNTKQTDSQKVTPSYEMAKALEAMGGAKEEVLTPEYMQAVQLASENPEDIAAQRAPLSLEKKGYKYRRDVGITAFPEYQRLSEIARRVPEELASLKQYYQPQMDLSGLMGFADVMTNNKYGFRQQYKRPDQFDPKEVAALEKAYEERLQAPATYAEKIAALAKGKDTLGDTQKVILANLASLQKQDTQGHENTTGKPTPESLTNNPMNRMHKDILSLDKQYSSRIATLGSALKSIEALNLGPNDALKDMKANPLYSGVKSSLIKAFTTGAITDYEMQQAGLMQDVINRVNAAKNNFIEGKPLTGEQMMVLMSAAKSVYDSTMKDRSDKLEALFNAGLEGGAYGDRWDASQARKMTDYYKNTGSYSPPIENLLTNSAKNDLKIYNYTPKITGPSDALKAAMGKHSK